MDHIYLIDFIYTNQLKKLSVNKTLYSELMYLKKI